MAVVDLRHGDCRTVMAGLPAASVDAVVCDPPYGLSFMGKDWDHGVPGVAFWSAALRVAKPGAHLLAFGGTRTFHRLAVAIEDAGWEIRDTVMWVYGSGFPKSHDVGKGIDKMDASEEQERRRFRFTAWVRAAGATARKIDEATNTFMGSHYTTHPTQPAIMTREHLEACRHLFGSVPEWVEREADIRSVESKNFAERAAVTTRKAADLFEAERDVAVKKTSGIANKDEGARHTIGASKSVDVPITAPATEAARQWDGWGTALKPAWEPIIVARKPLEGTVAANVLAHGVGALNIDASRVGTDGGAKTVVGTEKNVTVNAFGDGLGAQGGTIERPDGLGRWPANLIHDGSDEVLAGFPNVKGPGEYTTSLEKPETKKQLFGSQIGTSKRDNRFANTDGSAARFFYCAKASKADRDEGCEGMEAKAARTIGHNRCALCGRQKVNISGACKCENPQWVDVADHSPRRNHHPTVKPTALMRYLCKLVTPPAGTVLDPFMGSGSTGKAARMDGFGFIGIEQDADYIDIARARIAHAVQSPAQQPLHI